MAQHLAKLTVQAPFQPAGGAPRVEDGIEQQFAAWLREHLGREAGIAATALDGPRLLFPEEESHVAAAVPSRRIEFSAGRWCARQALGEVGIAPRAIRVGVRGAPIWPEGTCGSITHSSTHAGELCAAAAARLTNFAGLGIDIVDLEEAREGLPSSGSLFSTDAEIADARSLAASREQAHALAILFSAKESALKAMSSRFDRYVEFTEIAVCFAGAAFSAECSPFGTYAEGWWTLRARCVFRAAVLRERDA